MKTTKIRAGYYQVEKESKIFYIEKIGSNWAILDSKQRPATEYEYKTMKDCISDLEQYPLENFDLWSDNTMTKIDKEYTETTTEDGLKEVTPQDRKKSIDCYLFLCELTRYPNQKNSYSLTDKERKKEIENICLNYDCSKEDIIQAEKFSGYDLSEFKTKEETTEKDLIDSFKDKELVAELKKQKAELTKKNNNCFSLFVPENEIHYDLDLEFRLNVNKVWEIYHNDLNTYEKDHKYNNVTFYKLEDAIRYIIS